MDRIVALKLLPPRLAADEAFVKRFIREARSAAKLRHPNVVQAYDVGFADGHHYLAMEFVDGEPLHAILRRDGPLPPFLALRYAKETAAALDAAHRLGIVHRDIKPHNLMVDREGSIRVMDFGLAKNAEGDSSLTADGQVLGTPAYLSPEMAAGGGVDARSDLYSLGATLYHLLAGRPPFEGRRYTEILHKHVYETPLPLAELAPHVDPRLCRIIDVLLRKDPAARFPTAHALLDALEALGELAGAPSPPSLSGRGRGRVGSEPDPLPSSARKGEGSSSQIGRSRRRMAVYLGLLTAVLAAAAAAVLPTLLGLRSGSARPGDELGAQRAWRVVQAEAESPLAEESAKRLAARLGQFVLEHGHTRFARSVAEPLARLKARAGAAAKGWQPLFDGASLDGWEAVERFPVPASDGSGRGGNVSVRQGAIHFDAGHPLTGISWKGDFPTTDYEVTLEAARLGGAKDFCCAVFPIGTSRCALMLGAWKGGLVGLDDVDGTDCRANGTGVPMQFQEGRWYQVRLRVTPQAIEAWIDGERVLRQPIVGHTFAANPKWAPIPRFGLGAAWETKAGLRNIGLRRL